jgi:hypothetical protein
MLFTKERTVLIYMIAVCESKLTSIQDLVSQQVVSYHISSQFFWYKYRGEYLPPFKTKPTIVIIII